MSERITDGAHTQVITRQHCGADIEAQGYMCCPVPTAEEGIQIGVASDPDYFGDDS